MVTLIKKYVCKLLLQCCGQILLCLLCHPNPALTGPQESKHRRTDRSVLCCLKKVEPGKAWPRLSKDKAKVIILFALPTKKILSITLDNNITQYMLIQVTWLSVNFNYWKDWEDDSDEDLSSFDKFSEVRDLQRLALREKHVITKLHYHQPIIIVTLTQYGALPLGKKNSHGLF